jgi:pilus assembly protein Flp/PilA
MMDLLNRFFLAVQLARSDERGATAVEYGLIVALIAAVIILAVTALGTQVRDAFNSLIGLF